MKSLFAFTNVFPFLVAFVFVEYTRYRFGFVFVECFESLISIRKSVLSYRKRLKPSSSGIVSSVNNGYMKSNEGSERRSYLYNVYLGGKRLNVLCASSNNLQDNDSQRNSSKASEIMNNKNQSIDVNSKEKIAINDNLKEYSNDSSSSSSSSVNKNKTTSLSASSTTTASMLPLPLTTGIESNIILPSNAAFIKSSQEQQDVNMNTGKEIY